MFTERNMEEQGCCSMIRRPDMIMIGSTSRNTGKTEFACALIRRYASSVPVVGVKITTIAKADATTCPRGGQGCGVCTSVEGRFSLLEEEDASLAKDTSRMLKAGAHRVLWLRVLHEYLLEGIEALLAAIEEGSAIICESNSARTVVEPGVFLMIQKRGLAAVKPSACELMHLADQVVTFDPTGWDFSPELCSFDKKTWSARFAASAAILAGGQSLRMKQDKGLLPICGQPLIAHIAKQLTPVFPEVLVSSNEKDKYAFLGLPIVADQTPGQGPLMGILSCLKAARYDRVLIVACDIPTIDISFVRQLIRLSQDADIAIPLSEGGRHEPLLAVYRKSVIPRAEALLAGGKRRVVELFDGLVVKKIGMPSDWYRNLNTPEDLEDLCHPRERGSDKL